MTGRHAGLPLHLWVRFAFLDEVVAEDGEELGLDGFGEFDGGSCGHFARAELVVEGVGDARAEGESVGLDVGDGVGVVWLGERVAESA